MRAILHFPFDHPARALALATFVLFAGGCGDHGSREARKQESEEILFFPSLASASPDNASWSVTIQGRVFEPAEGSESRQTVIGTLALLSPKVQANANFVNRAGWLLSDGKPDRRVTVRIGDRTFMLSPSGTAGVFRQELQFTNEEIAKLAPEGIIPFDSVGAAKLATGIVYVVQPRGISVITDMDDTVKDTNMLDRDEKMQNTFQRDFRAVDGMSRLYGKWRAALGDRFHLHVVSAGPWQLYEPLQEFMKEAGFNPLSWEMRTVDIRDPHVISDELFSNLDGTQEFKTKTITALMTRFPDRHFVLVGDSGERDPEVYSQILGKFPDRVDAVLIRNVHGTMSRKPPVDSLFQGEAAKRLQVFVHPDAVSLPFAPTDLLPKREK